MAKFTRKFLPGALALGLLLITSACSAVGQAKQAKGQVESAEATTTTLAANIESSGTLNPVQDANLSWKTSGVIDKVLVKPGQKVKDGDTLATLVLTSVPANILAAKADMINAQKTLDDLNPTALAISQAEQRVAAVQDDIKTKQQIVDSLGVPARKADLDVANATVMLNKIQMDKAWDRYKEFQALPIKNQYRAALYNQWASAQQKYDQSVRRLNNLMGTYVNTTDLDLANANLELAKANLVDAQKSLDDLKAGPDAQDVAAAQARITAAQATLDALQISAPFDSEVLTADLLPGDVVNAGQPAITLANRDNLHVDTLIDESDIHGVNLGDQATLTLDTLPGKTLTGKVAFINPMGENQAGNVKYSVRIDLDPVDYPVLLNASADLKIQTGEPSEVLIVPVRAIQTDNQGEFVNRIQADGSLQRVDVVSGQLIGDQVVINSGDLKSGDRVELPQASTRMFGPMGGG
jgi:HlyD family secretion protein